MGFIELPLRLGGTAMVCVDCIESYSALQNAGAAVVHTRSGKHYETTLSVDEVTARLGALFDVVTSL